jgi:hypothetical protein
MVKHNKFFRIFTLAVILALLTVAIPATSVLAAERVTLTPTSGEIDDYVEIYASGFSEEEEDVYFYFSSEDADEGDEIDDEVNAYEQVALEYATHDTSFYTDFHVPDRLRDGDDDEDVESGDYYVYAAYDDGEILAKDEFRVIVISISIDPDKGVVGTEVEIEGSGFEDDESITVKFGGSTVAIESGDDETDSRGDFSCTILVPESTAGDHDITVRVGSDDGEAEFTVEPDIDIDPEEGTVGDTITVNGTGFAKSDDITINFDGDAVDITGDDETGSSGSFEAAFNVPEVGPGTYDVEVEDDSNNSASATFSITTDVSISPTTSVNSPGYVGMEVTISGSGFKASSEITITYASEPVVYYTTSESDGSFSYTFDAPPSTGGEHTITASDGTSSMSVTFVMESTPPVTPQPLLPYMDSKAGSQAEFDWEDVTQDISGADEPSLPITYELQIATDENFTNKLVNKTGLTTSEYKLTEEEALESTGSEAPYCWRIRSVDAASNASEWTGAGKFTVGFIFGFPELTGWVLYVLIAVGAIVFFFIGLLVGRRVAGGGGGYY